METQEAAQDSMRQEYCDCRLDAGSDKSLITGCDEDALEIFQEMGGDQRMFKKIKKDSIGLCIKDEMDECTEGFASDDLISKADKKS